MKILAILLSPDDTEIMRFETDGFRPVVETIKPRKINYCMDVRYLPDLDNLERDLYVLWDIDKYDTEMARILNPNVAIYRQRGWTR